MNLRLINLRPVFACVCVVLLSGCAAGISPVTGFAYSNVRGPLTVGPVEEGKVTKVGKATAKSILGLFASGDASIRAAVKNGKISKIHYVDYETKSVFGVVAEVTVIVYGS